MKIETWSLKCPHCGRTNLAALAYVENDDFTVIATRECGISLDFMYEGDKREFLRGELRSSGYTFTRTNEVDFLSESPEMN